ncbi:MAG TPA: AMP-binding protein [Nevskiaceae bacterium]|nr:AMP-binding protein [Nevskiaceae bacterium]
MNLPLIQRYAPDLPLAWRAGRFVPQGEFVAHVLALADALPGAPAALNLCEDRYRFTVAFAALLVRGQANLLPPANAKGLLADVAHQHPGCYALVDEGAAVPDGLPVVRVQIDETAAIAPACPTVPASRTALLAFSSGTTGAPRGFPKTWGALVATAALAANRFIGDAPGATIVATVPPQHMYGLETTVTLPLTSGARVHAGRPFFPRDVAVALDEVPAPRVLVTTPLHLRACLQAGSAWPAVHLVVSATAPLGADLAAGIEQWAGTQVHEIFGCTEAGSMASRRTVATDQWQLHPGMRIAPDDDGARVHAPHLGEVIRLQDRVELLGTDAFRFLGRADDMLKVAGKRASLADLTRRLLSIPGVEDAAVFLPDVAGAGEQRPAALVVAPTLQTSDIGAALEAQVDAVFVPRPIVRVARLPRDGVGKLPRAALLAELAKAHG